MSQQYSPSYPDPNPRDFDSWCEDLGLICEGECPHTKQLMSYEQFCFLPNVRLRLVRKTSLYGFWRKYGDRGECRTIREWLEDFNWEIVNPTKEDISDLNLFIGYDEFWHWGSGKMTEKTDNNK